MTSEQFEELKAIQDAYLEMANKRQEEVVEEQLEEAVDNRFSRAEKEKEIAADHKGEEEPSYRSKSPKRSGFSALDRWKAKQGIKEEEVVEEQLEENGDAWDALVAKRKANAATKKPVDHNADLKLNITKAQNSQRVSKILAKEEVFESERSEKYKTIVSSLDRMRAKAIANAELQKLQKQNKDHKKLPEEVEEEVEELDEKELTDIDVKQKEKVVKGMKKNLQGFKDKYGERAKGVMYATATKIAQKMPDVKEEVEELEELSKATLGSYVKKASDDKADFAFQQGQLAGNQTKNKVAIQTSIDKEKKRRAGVSKAVGKLTKEEVEELEELSKATLGSYVNKSAQDLGSKAYSMGVSQDWKNTGSKALKRQDGIKNAVKKLTKEEVEELEELSKKTLGSYIKKSIVDAAHKTRIAGDPSVKNVPGSGVDKRIDAGEKAVKRERNTEKAINKLTRESIELEEGNFEKNMDIIKSGKLPPHIQAILDKRGAKGNDAIMAKGRAEKLKSMKEMLDEARAKKEPMEIYHPSYSSAVQHAKAHAEKQGYEISDDDWHSNVTMGPGKPSGGKTTRHVIPLHKDGKLSKKGLAIQVHDRQTNNKPYELNSYIN